MTASCEEEKRGQLTLAIQTDMRIPGDVDQIRLEVLANGVARFANTYDIGKNSNPIPATIAIVAEDGPPGPLTIRLISRQGLRLRTLREAVTTIPQDRNVLLRMPIQWLCDDKAEESEGLVNTTCGHGQTCISGRCVDRVLESEELPDFAPEEVFGGGDGSGTGECLDTVACFAESLGETVSMDDCSVPAPGEDESTNVAMVLAPDTSGICSPDACLVPLDRDPEDLPFPVGWRRVDDRLVLPEAVCTRLKEKKALGVAVTTACKTKTPAIPTCGPWSSVTTTEATFDAPPPIDIVGLEDPCPDPREPGLASACITLDPEAVATMESDPELDGVGVLLVEIYDTPDITAADPIATLRKTEGLEELEEFDIGNLPFISLDRLPGTIYARAGFFDNPNELGFDSIKRGGAWIGGADNPSDPSLLRPIELKVDAGTSVTLPMVAARRLNVTVSVAEDATPSDGAEGLVAWTAYSSERPAPGAIPSGEGRRLCADLSGGPTVVTGHVFGPGPHYVVATLDDYGLGLDNAGLGNVPGSLVSGMPAKAEPSAMGPAAMAGDAGVGDAAVAQLPRDGGGMDAGMDADAAVDDAGGVWRIPDRVDFRDGQTANVAALSVALGHLVQGSEPARAPFDCPGGTCGDGIANGSETDIDCGGTCLPCEADRMCAGPSDCQSRVCESTCAGPTCEDGVQNGLETGTDCGGGACSQCAEGDGCLHGGDCESGTCMMLQCQP